MGIGGVLSIVYILFVFGYGFFASRRKASLEKSQPFAPSLFVSTASLCAAFIGGGFSLGNAAEGFADGFRGAVLLLGFSFGQLAVAFLLAPRFSRFPTALTAGDIVKDAFGELSKRLSGLLSIIFCIGILGAQISAFGSVAAFLFGGSRAVFSLVGFSGIILFAAFGGISASQKSDSIQVTVLFAGILLCLISVLFLSRGNLPPLSGELPRFPSAVDFLAPFLSFMTGELLCPPSVRRILLTKSGRTAKLSLAISGAVSVPFFFLTALMGILARVFGTTANADFAMPSLVSAALPFPLGPVICGAMLCVYLSSGCAFLLSCADALFFDLFTLSPDGKKRDNSALFRLFCVLCGGAALLLALAFDKVLSILLLAYCFWCPVMLVPLILALFGKKYKDGVFIASFAVSVFVLLLWSALGSPFGVPPMLAGLFADALFFIFYKRGSKN